MSKLNLSQDVLNNLWRVTPAALAMHLSKNEQVPWYAPKHLELLATKIVDVVAGRTPRLIVTMPPRCGKAVSCETPVLMGDGSIVELGDVAVGDEVVTHLGRTREVLEVFEQGELECLRIATSSGREVVPELSHALLTPVGWKTAEGLRVGDDLVIPRNFATQPTTNFSDEEFRLAGRLVGPDEPVPDWVFSASGARIAQFVGAYFSAHGSISSSGACVEFGSKRLLGGIRHLLTRLGILSYLRGSLVVERDSFDSFMRTIPASASAPASAGMSAYHHDRIVEVAPAGRHPCRCLAIDEDETFLANDFVVHNSELVSHWTPVWFLENFPWKRVILASYEADFAASWGRKARNTVARYNEMGTKQLRVRLDPNTQAVSHWMTTEGGSMTTAGVGGPITGKGGDLVVGDDVIKNFAEAESYTMRENLWNWWRSTLRTRVEPGGGMILAMTRWHQDDIAGRLIKSMEEENGERWEVFNYPMIAEDHDVLGRMAGQALWPARYDEKACAQLKASMGPKIWQAMYQQNPGAEDDQGNVYFCFDGANVREMDYDPHRPLVWSMDFNCNPMTGVLCQDYPGFRQDLNVAFVLDEIYLEESNTYKTMHEVAGRIFKMTGGRSTILEVYGDAAGRQKTANADKSSWEVVKQVVATYPFLVPQFKYRKANPLVKERVNSVNTMLCAADGSRRLFISGRCEKLIRDLRKLTWDHDGDGNVTSNIDKSNPALSHVSDALGYYINGKFKIRATGFGGKGGILQ